MRDSHTGRAMTLANMRASGVRAIFVTCACRQEVAADVSGWPGEMEIPALRMMLKCTECGVRPIDVRPDWREYSAKGNGWA